MEKVDRLQCYNKGCGQTFNPNENTDESCVYHPGGPIFHDAYKGWSCCSKKSTDFTTFLNMKGCTKGKHNPQKPVVETKQKPDLSAKDEVIVVEAPKQVIHERPSFESPLTSLPVMVSESLKAALKNQHEVQNSQNSKDSDQSMEGHIKIGESCKNSACTTTYEGKHSDLEICQYHPGIPIFHEGLKYWSCCQRKTTDFDTFLEQAGCATGTHMWLKKMTTKISNCRYDWHQTATHVVVTVYAKNALPDYTYVDMNPIRMKPHIVFGDYNEFELDLELCGVVDVTKSSVAMAATKVEIKLRKAEPFSWSKLCIDRPEPAKEENSESEFNKNENTDSISQGLYDVDLSNI